MATRYLEKLDSLASIDSLPTAAGIGVVGGVAYLNPGGGPVALGASDRFGFGTTRVVDPTLAADSNEIYETIQEAIDAAAAGDVIEIAPGSYDEAITITKRLKLVGLGGAGDVGVAPSATDAIAITISGTAASRTSGVQLVNIGGEGNGTGGGLKITGNVRRTRIEGGKFEGGAFAVTIESADASSVADTRILGAELCWSDKAVIITASGGGDPVSQTLIAGCHIHNVTDGIVGVTVHTVDAWILRNFFGAKEDATEATTYIDLAVASTTGAVAGNVFATTLLASAKFAIATGVFWLGNQVEAEGPATGGGTNGRPDA